MASAEEVVRRCRAIAGYSLENGAITRPFLSPPMYEVHQYLSEWMAQLGMMVHVDAGGNLRGVYAGATPGTPRLFIGSHLDTVPNAGAFDGVLGVVLGIALVERLAGARLPFPIEVVGFSDEEGVRFGVPFIGSRVLAGTFDERVLETLDGAGLSMRDAIQDFGLHTEAIEDSAASPRSIGYLEVHIEQGPVLDRMEIPVGVVEAIAGQTRVDVTFTGAAAHAGTTPMHARRDALAAAAEWMGVVEQLARTTNGLVATVARVFVHPGASNVVPGLCAASLDVRHADDDARAAAVASLAKSAEEIGARRGGVTITWALRMDQPAVAMNTALTAALERAVQRAGAPVHRLSSGAGHDAMIVASRMPAAMLFVRSPGGISHHPDESVRVEDVAVALDAARHFLDELAEGRR